MIRKRSKNNPTTMEPDWSLLLPDLLQAISEKVLVIADYIRFRAVCHPWRSASSPRPHHLPVQAPWLMLPSHSMGNDTASLFYDLSTSKINSLDLPNTSDVQICGCSHGWLVLHDYKRTTSLHNPITRTTISLPSYSCEYWDQIDGFSIVKAILTSSPLNPNCLVFVFIDELLCLAFCKIGDNRWTVIEILEDLYDISDFAYSNGFLYTVDHGANVAIYNLDGSSRREIVSHRSGPDANYLVVEGVAGDLLLIEISRGEYNQYGIHFVSGIGHKIYKITNNEQSEWIEVTDLGQNMLFVNGDQQAISLSSAHPQLQKWGANRLFFYSKWIVMCYNGGPDFYNHKIKLGKLDDGTVSNISGNLGVFKMPYHGQFSLWLTPSLF